MLVLASASPRRAELLGLLGVAFQVLPADLDESPYAFERPGPYVERLATEKAAAVFAMLGRPSDCVVLGADTTIDLDGAIVGKPTDRADAAAMLRALSGRKHAVHTGLAILSAAISKAIVVRTEVEFVALSSARIDWYLATGEAEGKAGAYALQGAGGMFVRGVTGSVSGVVGLPLAELAELLGILGVSPGGFLG